MVPWHVAHEAPRISDEIRQLLTRWKARPSGLPASQNLSNLIYGPVPKINEIQAQSSRVNMNVSHRSLSSFQFAPAGATAKSEYHQKANMRYGCRRNSSSHPQSPQ